MEKPQKAVRILIAEDDKVSRFVLENALVKCGYDVVVTTDGDEAWRALHEPDPPSIAILDWMMPGLDGLEVCRRIRQDPTKQSTYVILLTARANKEDLVLGMEAGADDYISKPFDREELRVRVEAGARMIRLQQKLADRVQDLADALAKVRQLQGLLPICSYCKRIRNDQNYWQQIENYIADHSGAEFSHGICPQCYEKFVTPQLQKRVIPGVKNS
jgi:DNA-binding response OmpR family regulator